LLADVFALYVKTKNFHWHMSGPLFRDYHLLLDEHGTQIFAMTDDIAELRADNQELTRNLRSATSVRKAQRCRYCQPDRELDRRDRAPDVVRFRDRWLGPS
jgi:starvation-inducible DNA-binding protein